MSQAPVEASEYQGTDKAFAEATVELNRQVDAGTSWSGNERNNLFLNLGRLQGPDKVPDFADVSALAGFDFPDDSRGLSALDWDFDGDLDFLVTNRTAPRVRILENRAITRAASFVSLKLVGSGDGMTRDAIGSRVELILKSGDSSELTLTRSLHAGQGYISQSSKWLHFGIPEGAEIVGVRVDWRPHGMESFARIQAGKFLVLSRGSGEAVEWSPMRTSIPQGESMTEHAVDETVIATLERPIPLPAIAYTDLAGEARGLPTKSGRPMLVNLWATWCAPCQVELKDFADNADVFTKTGVDVLALCVDVDATDAEASKILKKTGFPFQVGFANDEAIERIHIAHNTVFLRPTKLPVPSTLLIDADGRIASVARGPVHPAELEPALTALRGNPADWKDFARAFEGRWIHGPDTVFYVGIAKEMLDRGWEDDAATYLAVHRASLEIEGQKYAQMLMAVGTKLVERNQHARGLRLLQIGVEVSPELAAARNNLAVVLLQSGRGDEAVPHLEAAIASDPNFADPRVNLARYHLTKQRHDEALQLIGPVLDREYHPGAIRLKAQVLVAQKRIPELNHVFEMIVKQEPNDPSAWVNLAKLQLQLNGAAVALRSFEQAAKLAPENAEIQAVVTRLRQQLASAREKNP